MKQTFILKGEIIPKARPKVTRNGTFYPPRYKDFLEDATRQLIIQKKVFRRKLTPPCELEIVLYNPHRRGDCDNLAGSIMDVLVRAEILPNDNLNSVCQLFVAYIDDGRRLKSASVTLTNGDDIADF